MEEIKRTLSRALFKLLHPIVHILLRHEVSHAEFSELARRVYVDVAFKHFGLPNRKNTASRVSVLTGLSRKEVVRLAAIEPDQAPQTNGPLNRASRVVIGWISDPIFIDKHKQPRQLSLRGGDASFEELVKRYSGGITSRAVLDELLRVGVVSKIDAHTVKLNHYGYLPEDSDSELIEVLCRHSTDLLSTGNYNLTRDKSQKPRFQRQVTYVEIPQDMAEAFEKYSHEKLSTLIMEMNQWLATHKSRLDTKHENITYRIGVGAYFFQNQESRED